MPQKKVISISKARCVQFTITDENRKQAAYLEGVLMRNRGLDDCSLVPNADVLNSALSLAFRYLKRKPKSRVMEL